MKLHKSVAILLLVFGPVQADPIGSESLSDYDRDMLELDYDLEALEKDLSCVEPTRWNLKTIQTLIAQEHPCPIHYPYCVESHRDKYFEVMSSINWCQYTSYGERSISGNL